MKKGLIYKAIVLFAGVVLAGTAYAGDMDHSAHGAQKDTIEKPFHESMVDGYHFKYKLIDMRAKLKNMKGAEHVAATHHLMVFVSMKHGTSVMQVTEAKAGYLVVAPDGKKSQAMSMAMGGGYGADINLGQKGEYTIKTKIVAGGKKVVDTFKHTMK